MGAALNEERADVFAIRPTEEARPSVVIADDDYDVRDVLARMFVRDGFEVTLVSTGKSLVEALDEARRDGALPDVMVIDHLMPGYTGLEILETMHESGWRTPVILMTAFHGIAEEGRDYGAIVLEKPFDPEKLRSLVWDFLGLDPAHLDEEEPFSLVDMDPPRCASCGSRVRLVMDGWLSLTCFCSSCRDNAPHELGEGD